MVFCHGKGCYSRNKKYFFTDEGQVRIPTEVRFGNNDLSRIKVRVVEQIKRGYTNEHFANDTLVDLWEYEEVPMQSGDYQWKLASKGDKVPRQAIDGP